MRVLEKRVTDQHMIYRWLIVSLALSASWFPVLAFAEEKCGGGTVVNGNFRANVTVFQKDVEPPMISQVFIEATSADQQFTLLGSYNAVKGDQISLKSLTMNARMPIPDQQYANPEHMAWRVYGGEWVDSNAWLTPTIVIMGSKKVSAFISLDIISTGNYPFGGEHVEQLRQGLTYEIKRVDKDRKDIATGMVSYPKSAAIFSLYKEARQIALKDMKPCGPPVYIKQAE